MSDELLKKIKSYFREFPYDETAQNNIIRDLINEKNNTIILMKKEHDLKIKELMQNKENLLKSFFEKYNKKLSEKKKI